MVNETKANSIHKNMFRGLKITYICYYFYVIRVFNVKNIRGFCIICILMWMSQKFIKKSLEVFLILSKRSLCNNEII